MVYISQATTFTNIGGGAGKVAVLIAFRERWNTCSLPGTETCLFTRASDERGVVFPRGGAVHHRWSQFSSPVPLTQRFVLIADSGEAGVDGGG